MYSESGFFFPSMPCCPTIAFFYNYLDLTLRAEMVFNEDNQTKLKFSVRSLHINSKHTWKVSTMDNLGNYFTSLSLSNMFIKIILSECMCFLPHQNVAYSLVTLFQDLEN